MTSSAAAAASSGRSVAAYEQLRSHVVTNAVSGSHLGLALLLRQGVAAWLSRGSADCVPSARAAAEPSPQAPAAAHLASDQLCVHLVQVLASMDLGGRDQEIRK